MHLIFLKKLLKCRKIVTRKYYLQLYKVKPPACKIPYLASSLICNKKMTTVHPVLKVGILAPINGTSKILRVTSSCLSWSSAYRDTSERSQISHWLFHLEGKEENIILKFTSGYRKLWCGTWKCHHVFFQIHVFDFFPHQLSNYFQQCLVLRVRFHCPKLQSTNTINTGLNKESNRCKDVSSAIYTWSEKTVSINIADGEDEQQEADFLLCV